MSTLSDPSPWPERSATLSVAALALGPFLTLSLTPSQRLPTQAALLGVLLLAQAPWLTRAAPRMPTLVRLGISAWIVAAAWGTAVGSLSGNPLRYVVGQSLSMFLLPLGALAFWRRAGFGARPLARGLAAAALIALALHLVLPHFGLDGVGSGPMAEKRLRLVPGVSFVGTALLTGLVCLGALLDATTGRWLIGAGALASGILVIGGFSRGQWLAGLLGLGVLATSLLERRWRVRAIALALAMLTLGMAAVIYTGFVTSPLDPESSSGPSLHIGSGSSPTNQELAAVDWAGEPGLEVTVRVQGPSAERLQLWTEARPGDGTRFQRTYTRAAGGGESPSLVRATVSMPASAQQLRVGVWASGGEWAIDDLRLQVIDSGAATWIHSWASRPTTVRGVDPSWFAVAQRRAQQLTWALLDPSGDDTMRYRADESAAVIEAWRAESWVRRGIGAGLGATVGHAIPSFDDHGERIVLERTNYLHNFYLFLVLKLGIFGLLPFAAILVFIVQARQLGQKGAWLGRATTATWLAYALWSVTSPEILDFRRAVLWGLLIAACAREEIQIGRGGEDG